MRRVAATMILSLLANSCAVGPNYRPPTMTVPASWVGAPARQQRASTTQAADLAQWWRQLGDATLTELIERALRANLDVAMAEANLRHARAIRSIAAGGLWPSATAAASYQREEGPAFESPAAHNLYQAGLDATWELDIFGGTRRGVESASANVQAAIANLQDVQVSVAAEVALAYVQLRGNQQQVVTARSDLTVQRHTADITRKLYQVGFDSGLDLANAQSTVSSTQAQIPVYEAGARQSIYALSVLLAQPPGALLERLAPAADLPKAPEEIPAGLPSDLLRRRPDIRQAEAELHSATAQIGVAVAQLFPQFSLTGGATWESTGLHDWLHSASRSTFVGPVASWPIFQGGAIVANVRAQQALRDEAFVTYRQSVLTALQDVETALIALSEEQQRHRSLSDAVAADHRAVELSLRLFQEGQTDFLNVLTAERTLYADDSALTQSRQNLIADFVALYKALGGGWRVGPSG